MFKNRLASHLERGVIGFPTTLASSVGLIMASPVILTVTSGFGSGGDTFALAVLLAFIMMQAQITTFAEAATLIPASVICQPEAGCDGLSAAIRSLGGIHLIQIAARLRRWMSGG